MTAPSGNKRGRPFKSDVKALTPGNRNAVGRPKGDAAIMNEFKARMLNSPKSASVLEKIFDAALTDGHPGQTAAWKLIADRIVPVSTFDSMKNSNSTPTISINISSLSAPTIETVQEVYTVDSYSDSDTESVE